MTRSTVTTEDLVSVFMCKGSQWHRWRMEDIKDPDFLWFQFGCAGFRVGVLESRSTPEARMHAS